MVHDVSNRPRLSLPNRPLVAKTERRNGGRPTKPPAWTHQSELKSLIGQIIRVQFLDGAVIGGILKEADAYTLRLSSYPNRKSTLTYFKSAMRSYGRIDPSEIDSDA